MNHETTILRQAQCAPGVRYRVARISFGQRIGLTRQVLELGRKLNFLEAGTGLRDQVEAGLLGKEIDRIYLQWGLREVEGLKIDGREATPEDLIEGGPEELCEEILRTIKGECGLSEEERKN